MALPGEQKVAGDAARGTARTIGASGIWNRLLIVKPHIVDRENHAIFALRKEHDRCILQSFHK